MIPVVRYLSVQLVIRAVVLVFVLFVLFLLIHAGGGQVRDSGLFNDFAGWSSRFVSEGSLGLSSSMAGATVWDRIVERSWPTLLLLAYAYAIAWGLALPLGTIAGLRPASKAGRTANVVFDVFASSPDFWIANLAILAVVIPLYKLFGDTYIFELTSDEFVSPFRNVDLSMLVDGRIAELWRELSKNTNEIWRQATLPALSLGLGSGRFAVFARQVTEEAYRISRSGYVELAIARGLKRRRILTNYIAPNMMIPILSHLLASVPVFIGGAIVVEVIFTYQGLGLLIYDACQEADYAVLAGLTLVLSGFTLILDLVNRLVLIALDPRIRS